MILTDSAVALDRQSLTPEGYLVAFAKVARSGVYDYLGSELDPDGSLGLRDKGVVKVYRPEDEVFAADSLASFAYRTVTHRHPKALVNSKNWREVAVGNTGSEVVRDGEFVRVPLVIMDADAIRAVQSGDDQLSMGYQLKLVVEDGVTPSGEKYQAKQTQMRMNHLALVPVARGGADLRIGDGVKMKQVLIDGLPVEIANDQGAAIVERHIAGLTKQVTDANTALATATEAHGAALAKKDGEIAAKDAEIEKLKANVLDAKALDARVIARGELVTKAKALHSAVVTDGKSDMEIKRDVLTARGVTLDGKSDAYIEARFDGLAEDAAGTAPLRTAIDDALKAPLVVADAQAADAALAKANGDMNAWRNAAA